MSRRRRRHYEDDGFEFDPRDPLQAVLDQAMEHPRVRDGMDAANRFFDRFGHAIDRAAERAPPAPADPRQLRQRLYVAARQIKNLHARAQLAEQRARHAERNATAQTPKEDPFLILGFSMSDRLTSQMIRKRRQELAVLCHPDKGGSSEVMARINRSADALLAKTKH